MYNEIQLVQHILFKRKDLLCWKALLERSEPIVV